MRVRKTVIIKMGELKHVIFLVRGWKDNVTRGLCTKKRSGLVFIK